MGEYEYKDRFWSKVDIAGPDECWEWQSAMCYTYGTFWFKGKNIMAHRLSWMIANNVEEFPQGKVICHSCDNRICVNPAHLWLGTQKDNQYDSIFKVRHTAAKLTEKEKEQIRQEYIPFVVTQTFLGKKYGVNPSVISDIVNSEPYIKGVS